MKKLEAERLKKQQKKRNKDKLREQEDKLKKQIDVRFFDLHAFYSVIYFFKV